MYAPPNLHQWLGRLERSMVEKKLVIVESKIIGNWSWTPAKKLHIIYFTNVRSADHVAIRERIDGYQCTIISTVLLLLLAIATTCHTIIRVFAYGSDWNVYGWLLYLRMSYRMYWTLLVVQLSFSVEKLICCSVMSPQQQQRIWRRLFFSSKRQTRDVARYWYSRAATHDLLKLYLFASK